MNPPPASTFRFAQISDPHLTDPGDASLRELAGKRVLGYLSWRRRRRHEHRPERLASLASDLHAIAPDHTVVTGDLTHIALPQEFRQAREWLTGLGRPEDITVVPGNHDRYVDTPWEQTLGEWNAYMRGDGSEAGPEAFPTLRIRGPVAFIGLCSAVPSGPFLATGRLGSAQLARLDALLASLEERALLRVLLIHHPPVPGEEKWRKRLVDAPALCALLARRPVGLVLHGHRHRPRQSLIRIPGSEIPVFGIPSASAMGVHGPHGSGYNTYAVESTAEGWRVSARARNWDEGSRAYRECPLGELLIARKQEDSRG
ncbi:MAG: metallophosphoesterase family protein [Gammaproteobacteria bacterium]